MGLMPVNDAQTRILSLINPLPVEEVQIDEALGRSVATPVAARRTLPPWDNSAMDGYAVSSSDAATTFEIIEKIFAGDVPQREISAGQCARIMTGAPLPKGADAVVMQEKTRALEGARVELLERARPSSAGSRRENARGLKARERCLVSASIPLPARDTHRKC